MLEHVSFDKKGSIKLIYDNNTLSGLTTKEYFLKLFHRYTKANIKKDSILLINTGSDDGTLFIFKNGKLTAYQYWSPC